MAEDEQPGLDLLPVIGQQGAVERADAARNRESVLCAAQKLFAKRGVENVSMEEVAAEAGVGKGTLFRRFGDRATLVYAVLDEYERRFQEQILRGDPPVGPGAAPGERMIAFGDALIQITRERADLMLAAEAGDPRRRFRSPVYAFYRLHLRNLIREAEPDCDQDYLSDVLLQALAPGLLMHLGDERAMEVERIRSGFTELVSRLFPG